MIKPIPLDSNFLSPLANSEIDVRATSVVPLPNPMRNRETMAAVKEVLKPKMTAKIAELIKLNTKTNFLPYRSAIFPHGYDEKARPIIKLLARNPAYFPALSSVRPGIRNMHINPEYGKTLINKKNVVNTHAHNANVDMKYERSVS